MALSPCTALILYSDPSRTVFPIKSLRHSTIYLIPKHIIRHAFAPFCEFSDLFNIRASCKTFKVHLDLNLIMKTKHGAFVELLKKVILSLQSPYSFIDFRGEI